MIKLITSMYKLIRSPSMRREWIEMYCPSIVIIQNSMSPSMRREWIEI